MACHHRPLSANTVERRRVMHAIIAFVLVDTVERRRAWHEISARGLHTRSDDVECGMTSRPSTTHMVKRRRKWHAIISFGQHTRSNDVKRGMPSSPLGITNDRMTSGVACHHRHCTSSHSRTTSPWHAIIAFGLADKVGRRQAWHAIITFGEHRRSNDNVRGIPSSPLD